MNPQEITKEIRRRLDDGGHVTVEGMLNDWKGLKQIAWDNTIHRNEVNILCLDLWRAMDAKRTNVCVTNYAIVAFNSAPGYTITE